MHGRDVYVVDAVRTPIGKHGGGLGGVRPDDLLTCVLRALEFRNPTLDPGRVDEVYAGAANQSGEDNRNVARMAVLLAGWPTSVAGSTVNRLCASGLDAVIGAARAIAVGDASIMVAGGVESMTRSPWVLAKPARGYPRGDETLHSTTLGWRLVNPEMPGAWTISLGESTELLAVRYGIEREAADEFALRSHELALNAWANGSHDRQVTPVPGTDLSRDETIREGLTLEQLAGLRTVFREDGQVTAGNASSLNDGAAAMLLADEAGLKELGAEPLARIVASGAHAVDPDIFGIGPVGAVDKALSRSGHTTADVRVMELNEAFAAQSLACLSQWPGLDPDVVNPLGGAIAIGHPLGASGTRLAGSVAHQLAAAGSGVGVAALCIGVGQGLALVMER